MNKMFLLFSWLIFTVSNYLFLFINSITPSDLQYITGQFDFTEMNGFQMLLINRNIAKFFVSLDGDSKIINGEAILYFSFNSTVLESTDGIWVAIGLGSNKMHNADMITFKYLGNNITTADDSYCPSYARIVDTDSNWGDNNSYNNVVLKSFTKSDISVIGYHTKLQWSFTKDILNIDKYDWADIRNWQYNEGYIYAAWGYIDSDGNMLNHKYTPSVYNIIDGVNLNNSQGLLINNLTLIVILVTILF